MWELRKAFNFITFIVLTMLCQNCFSTAFELILCFAETLSLNPFLTIAKKKMRLEKNKEERTEQIWKGEGKERWKSLWRFEREIEKKKRTLLTWIGETTRYIHWTQFNWTIKTTETQKLNMGKRALPRKTKKITSKWTQVGRIQAKKKTC